jgi:hypothetical protein
MNTIFRKSALSVAGLLVAGGVVAASPPLPTPTVVATVTPTVVATAPAAIGC